MIYVQIIPAQQAIDTTTIITDRPGQSENSSTLRRGFLQIEGGLSVHYEGEETTTKRQIIAPITVIRYGITNVIELRMISQFETVREPDQHLEGISDFLIGSKIQIFKSENSLSEVALVSQLSTPTGTGKLSNEQFGTINRLAIMHIFSVRSSLAYNIGYDYFGADKGNLFYSLVYGLQVNPKVYVYAEPYGQLVDFKTATLNMNGGFTYLVSRKVQLDFFFGMGVNHNMNYVAVGLWVANT